MTKPAAAPRSRSLLGPVAAALLLSGTGSLVMEVCWSRLLKLVFGSTTLAISTILVAYMLGLGIGGLLGGRIARRLKNGIAAYGWMELGIAVYALAVPFVVGLFPSLNSALLSGMSFWPAALIRFVLALVVFLIPTVLMGATLPVLVAAVTQGWDDLARRVGLLYGINTLGAVLGTLGATFLLFPAVGVFWTNVIGAVMDAAAGLIALLVLAPRLERAAAEPAPAPATPARKPARAAAPADAGGPASSWPRWNLALLSYGLVGFTALAYEVAWTRALTMVFGSSVYAFSAMLSAFLIGIALIGRRFFDRLKQPVRAYALGLLVLGLLSFLTLFLLRQMNDVFLRVYETFGLGGRTVVIASFVLSILAMLGPTLVLGALFPLLTRTLSAAGREPSETVGDVYFVNTLGSATGAFLAGFVLIPWLGLSRTMTLAVAINLLSAAVVLLWQSQWKGAARTGLAVAAGAAGIAVALIPPVWSQEAMTVGAYYRPQNAFDFDIELDPFEGIPVNEIAYYRDGVSATVSIHRQPDGITMKINGKPDASLKDMSTQVLSGHLPLLFGGPVERVMVIGYASGVTTGAASLHPVRAIDIVEIEPAVIEASHFFDPWNHRPLEDPRVRVILDDGRSYLAATREKYDVIISEPSNPFLSGCSNLFTREFFHAARRALNPGGRLLQWIQLYGMDPPGVASVLEALRSEFPYAYAFQFLRNDGDLMLLASDRPLTAADLPRWEALPPAVREDLEQLRLLGTEDLWSLMRLTSDDLAQVATLATHRNTDDSMYVELHAPWRIQDTIDENVKLLERFNSGILPVAEAGASPLSAEQVGALAYFYAAGRIERGTATRLVAEAKRRGPSGMALCAEGFLLESAPQPDPGTALRMYEQAVQMAPDRVEPKIMLARALVRGGRGAEALPLLDTVLAADPRNALALGMRMRVNGQAGRYSAGWADGKVLAGLPVSRFEKEFVGEAAVLAMASGQTEDGLALMADFLRWNPLALREWEVYEEILRRNGRTAEADTARRNREAAVRNQVLLTHRSARYEMRFGSKEIAKQLLESVVQREPDNKAARKDLEALQ
ncbi:MAG: fused MFS/spermidine synthase [Acidobacteria bacterium]|nr:fused MFS/spermidine synthase [Acidobacteriota bacterium]